MNACLSILQRLIGALFVGMICLLPVAASSDEAGGGPSIDPHIYKALAKQTRVPVLVTLRVRDEDGAATGPVRERSQGTGGDATVHREGVLAARQSAAALAQQRFRENASSLVPTVTKTYRNFPVLRLEVTLEQLEDLIHAEDAQSVILDRRNVVPRGVKATALSREESLSARHRAAADQALAARAEKDRHGTAGLSAQASDEGGPVREGSQSLSTMGYVDADLVWDQGYTGSGQAVAILDDGIDPDHAMFAGKLVGAACFSYVFDSTDTSLCPSGLTEEIGTGAASKCGQGDDICLHGTHVAGIAAGRDDSSFSPNWGVAPDARIIPIQVFTLTNDTDFCDGASLCSFSYTSSQLAAADYVAELSAKYNIAAINMSLGGSDPHYSYCDDDITKSAVDTLRSLEIATVIAAGNEAYVGAVSSPGCISTAVTVSSVIITVPDDDVNHAPMVDLLAPGYLVRSALPGNTYGTLTGTSMATPHVAGAFALLRSANPSASIAAIEAALKSSGPLEDLYSWSWETPRIDLDGALDALGADGSVSPRPTGLAIASVYSSATTAASSYIRVFNTSAYDQDVTLSIVDDETGDVLGTYEADIDGGASVQLTMADVERGASPPITGGSNGTTYSVYVNADFSGYVQHVIWNVAGGSLTNLSGCANGLSDDGVHFNNVHTSLIMQNFPSYLLVHNAANVADTPDFDVYDSRDGDYLGGFTLSEPIPANSSTVVFLSDTLEFLGITPESDQFHINVEIRDGFNGFGQHIVDNIAGGVLTNMTAKCGL